MLSRLGQVQKFGCKKLAKVTRNVLDCDQRNYSSRIIFSYFYPRTKHEVDRTKYGHSKFSKTRGRSSIGRQYIHWCHI